MTITIEAHAVVEITDDKAWRSNMKKWALADLQNPAIIVHENLHIPGLPDLYNEEYVHGNIRDHTFSPGYILLDPQNIMVRHGPTSIIRAWQMRSIIAKATPGTKLFWKEASHHETLNVGISWEHIARARSDMQHDQPNEELSIVGPRHPWMNPFITSAEDHLRRGEVARGLELMHMAWSSGLSRHDRRQLADLFWAYGYRKETFFLLQEGLEKNPRDSSLLESMAAFSLLSKEPQAAHDYAEQAVQQCDQCLYSNLYLILSLFELGQIKEAKETYTRATEKIHSARQKELREETTRYLIRKGNIAEAEEIYMDESWHDDGTKWRFFNLLVAEGRYHEAKKYYEQAFLQRGSDLETELDWTTYIALLHRLGENDLAVTHLTNMVIRDPYSLEKRFSLAQFFVRTKKYKKAMQQFAEIAAIGRLMNNTHKLRIDRDALKEAILTSLPQNDETEILREDIEDLFKISS